MKLALIFPLLLVLFFFNGCAPQYREPPMTQLQIREIQSREFDTNDSKLVMKSMMNVLQDEGFIIKNAVLDLGLLNAERTEDIGNTSHARMMYFLAGEEARWDKQTILDASGNVSEFGNKTRVRMNFQIKTIDNKGNPSDTRTILDPVYYQSFFEKVSKGLFIQQENI